MKNESGMVGTGLVVGTENATMVAGATMVAAGIVVDVDTEEMKRRCAKSFQLGVDFYLDGGLSDDVDEQEFHRRCQEVFDKAWARGGGRFLADRRGWSIHYVASWAAKSVRGVSRSIFDDMDKARAAATTAAGVPDTIEKIRERIKAIRARARKAAAGEKI